jgi:hypothetical protein
MQEKLVIPGKDGANFFNFDGGIISNTAQPFFSIQALLEGC